MSSKVLRPREGRSAGFDTPGQWFHKLGWTLRRISSTRFRTKGFHSLFTPRIQYNAISESVKHWTFSWGKVGCKLLETVAISLDNKNADSNSKRGMVCVRRGATLVFDTTNRTLVLTSTLITRYTTAAYACNEASQNPLSVMDVEDPLTQ